MAGELCTVGQDARAEIPPRPARPVGPRRPRPDGRRGRQRLQRRPRREPRHRHAGRGPRRHPAVQTLATRRRRPTAEMTIFAAAAVRNPIDDFRYDELVLEGTAREVCAGRLLTGSGWTFNEIVSTLRRLGGNDVLLPRAVGHGQRPGVQRPAGQPGDHAQLLQHVLEQPRPGPGDRRHGRHGRAAATTGPAASPSSTGCSPATPRATSTPTPASSASSRSCSPTAAGTATATAASPRGRRCASAASATTTTSTST